MSHGFGGGWNYRVLVKKYKRGELGFDIHEVYYTRDGSFNAWSTEPIAPHGDSLSCLESDLEMMREALGRPLLKEVTGKNGVQRLVRWTKKNKKREKKRA